VNGVACANYGDDYHREPTSIGLPPAAVELRIVDPITLVTLKEGEQGEVSRAFSGSLTSLLTPETAVDQGPWQRQGLLQPARGDARSIHARWLVPRAYRPICRR
jgi:hypothetical protein